MKIRVVGAAYVETGKQVYEGEWMGGTVENLGDQYADLEFASRQLSLKLKQVAHEGIRGWALYLETVDLDRKADSVVRFGDWLRQQCGPMPMRWRRLPPVKAQCDGEKAEGGEAR